MTARDFGPKPELAWLPVDALYVDPSYQRTMESRKSIALIERMLKGFRWSAFGVVLVAPTKSDGITNRYAIMDGQHRTTVAGRLGIREVPCVIIAADSIAEQAAAFLAANQHRVQVNAFALHDAQMVAGDRHAALIDQACKEAGVEIPKYPIPATHLKTNQTLAIGAIRAAIDASNTRAAANALRVIRQAFPDEIGALRAYLITGIHAALMSGAGVDDLVATLKRAGFKSINRKAMERSRNSGVPKWKAVKIMLARGAAPSKSVEIRQNLTRSAEVVPAPPAPRPKPRPQLRASEKPSPFDPTAKPVSTDQAEIERHIAKKGVTKCPTAYVAPTEGGKGEFKVPEAAYRPEPGVTEQHAAKKRLHSAQIWNRP